MPTAGLNASSSVALSIFNDRAAKEGRLGKSTRACRVSRAPSCAGRRLTFSGSSGSGYGVRPSLPFATARLAIRPSIRRADRGAAAGREIGPLSPRVPRLPYPLPASARGTGGPRYIVSGPLCPGALHLGVGNGRLGSVSQSEVQHRGCRAQAGGPADRECRGGRTTYPDPPVTSEVMS